MDFGIAEFEERLPDADAVRTHASETMAVGVRVSELMDSLWESWLRLTAPGTYDVAGNEKVFTALDASRTAAEELSNHSSQIDTVMRTYADSIDLLKVRLGWVKERAEAFNSEYPESEKDEWDNDQTAVDARNDLVSDVGHLHEDLDEAQRDAATRITHITGSARIYEEYDESDPDTQARRNPEAIIYGYDHGMYVEELFGGLMSKDLPWHRDVLNFAGDTIIGVPKAGWELVTDLGILVGFEGWNKAGNAWKNMVRVADNLIVVTSPIYFGSGRHREAVEELMVLGPQLIRYDQWNSDHPGYALGGNIFDLGSIFLGGAGAAKAGTKAATLGQHVAGAGKRAASVPEHLGILVEGSTAEQGGGTPPSSEGDLPVTPRQLESPDKPRFRDGKGSAGGKDFAETYSPNGRDPANQPRVGDTDGGNGSFQDMKGRSINGAPEQQYITGIDRTHETQAREYVVQNRDGVEVAFDGHTWRGDPPVEVFQEVKGHLDFLDNIKPDLLAKRLEKMIQRELSSQINALKHSGTPGYIHEWVFTEKVVMDSFEQVMRRYPQLRNKIQVRFEPMP